MIFKQKKGFLLRDFVVVGILFGLVISLYITMVASVANNYNNQDLISPSFAEHYSKLQTNINLINNADKAVQGENGLNLVGVFNVAFNSVFTVVAMVWDTVLIYTGMATTVSQDFSFIDKATAYTFLTGILAIIVTYLIFIWISSVSRGKI